MAITLIVFGVLVAPAGARSLHAKSHSHAPKCVKHQGRKSCRLPSPRLRRAAAAPPLLEMLSRVASAPVKRNRHHISARTFKAAVKRLSGLDAIAARLEALPETASSAAGHVADAGTETVSAGGWSGSSTLDVPVHSNQTGVDVTATVRLSKGDAQGTWKETDTHLVADCPDAKGSVPGTARYGTELQVDVPAANGFSVRVYFSWRAQSAVTGHTATDGTLHNWDQSMKYLAHVQAAVMKGNKVIETTEPAVWTTHADATLTSSHEDTPSGLTDNFAGPGVFTLYGTTYATNDWRGQTSVLARKLAGFAWMQLSARAEADFAKAKADHWDTGDCVKLNLSAPEQQLAAGEQVQVTGTLSGAPGRGVAPATLTTSATDGAVVTPPTTTADSAPVALSAIAPSPFNPGDSFTVTVNAISRQGRGSGSITFQATQGTYVLHYTHSTSGTASYGYDHSTSPFTDTGNWNETRDVQVTATVALTRNSDGSFSGSAPVQWSRSTWTQENDESSNEGPSYPSICELDDIDTVTATTDGTLSVSSLTIGTQPSASVTLQSLAENWHQNDQAISGPCPGYTQDYARNTLLYEIGGDHSRAGDHVSYPSSGGVDVSFSSDWTPGTGGVVATRTLTGTEPSGPDGDAAIRYTDTFEIDRVS